jgi:nicotinamide-nucleotide amidase
MLTACIITIGDELLQGFTLDTNSAWIAQTLLPYNIQTVHKITIGDKLNDIKTTIKSTLNDNYNYIFVTGGLGPTHDDITKEAVKQVFQAKSVLDKSYLKELETKFQKRGLEMPANNESQAVVLDKAESIVNHNGTALGMKFDLNDSHIFVLPGVPREMKTMVKKEIIPKYIRRNKTNNITTIKTTGIIESKLSDLLTDSIKLYKNKCSFAFLPHYTGVSVRLKKNESFDGNFNEIVKTIYSKLTHYAYGIDNDTLPKIVSENLIKHNMTLATAESCTGGLIAKYFTDIPGSSRFFYGGAVTYNNALKHSLAGVDPQIIKTNGAVSEEVALAMAIGIKNKTESNIGIGTTGISGPGGGSVEKPVGIVYIAIASDSKQYVKKFNMIPSRKEHREMTAITAINMVRKFIHG